MNRLVLAGGGLANSLLAYRLAACRPEVEILVVERGETLGGNHVWCFHDTDLTAAQRDWIAPLVEWSWDGYDVRFPGHSRRLRGTYHALTSERLHRVVGAALAGRVRYETSIRRCDPTRIELDDGDTIDADAVVDGRGMPPGAAIVIAWQKFVGLWVELEADHDLDRPIMMDATVEQRDGYRFLYTLPFGDRLLHVEDTRYSDTPGIDLDGYKAGILEYCRRQGWRPASIEREEAGALPVVLGGDIQAFWEQPGGEVPRSGMRSALFHPTTGYSLPDAVRLADAIAGEPELTAAALYASIRRTSVEKWRRDGFYRLINRMMFRAADPVRRYRVLERFYRLPESLIERFYADRLTGFDRLRILTGRPPVPVHRALRCLRNPTVEARSV
jgi:lycopene beta-cyclase